MSRRDPIHDHIFESVLFTRRVIVAVVVGVLLVSLLVGRLVFLQLSSYDHYSTLSKNNRVRLRAVAPPRGLIYDRNGVVLAENRPSYRLEITPEEVDDMDMALQRISQVVEVTDSDVERFKKSLRRARPFEAIPLLFNLDEEKVAKVSVVRHELPGVDITARLTRHYPRLTQAVHTIGYVGRIDERELQQVDQTNYAATNHIGKIGIEKFYEDRLHGRIGYQRVEVNVAGRVLRVLEEQSPIAGQNLYLTLDIALQKIAEHAMGEHAGSLVAMDPISGDVLAMVSQPTFDPNLFVNGISHSDYNRLRDDPERPLFNRALTGQYPPGSTIKPMIGLAGLKTKIQGRAQRSLCRGWYSLPNDDRLYRDWKKTGHGFVNLADAIVQSCDVLFYDLALRLGIDNMSPVLDQFGFGLATGIDNPGEANGLLPSREWKRATKGQPWFPGETLITGIGQGYMLVTPLQLARATAILSTRGKPVQPRLLHSVQPSPSVTPHALKPAVSDPAVAFSDADWDYVHESMLNVAHHPFGTAYRANLGVQYKVAAKTGTAQVYGIAQDGEYEADKLSKELHDHALYIAYAPADKPEIVVAVVAEHGGSGGSVAAPIARTVLDAYLSR
ncbi:MAG: penicillin-binding protein 2 [Pseudomonadota bacterium]